jgi:hypothetical protein
VLLLYACHAGAFGTSSTLLAMRSANAGEINRMLIAMGQAQDGIAVLSSSSAAERSQEGPQFCGGHGAFTCALLNGLRGDADTDRNGLVQMRELYDYTYREVKRLTTGYQNPAIEGRYDNGLPLAFAVKSRPAPPAVSSAVKVESGLSAALSQAEQELKALEEQERQVEEANLLAAIHQQIEEKKRQIEEKKKKPIQVAKAPTFEAPRQAGKEITGRDGAPMVLVPAGEFIMGSNDGDADEKPERRVTLEAFYIDKFEVSTRLYAAFIQATSRSQPEDWSKQVALVGSGDRPVVNVTWHDADAYCRHYGKCLPTEQEWEKAARGTDGREYPWGNEEPSSQQLPVSAEVRLRGRCGRILEIGRSAENAW